MTLSMLFQQIPTMTNRMFLKHVEFDFSKCFIFHPQDVYSEMSYLKNELFEHALNGQKKMLLLLRTKFF